MEETENPDNRLSVPVYNRQEIQKIREDGYDIKKHCCEKDSKETGSEENILCENPHI